METVTYEYSNLCIHIFDMMCSIDFSEAEFEITGDLLVDKRIDFQTNYPRHSVNTTGHIVNENGVYSIGVVRACRVSNPIELSVTIRTPEGIKQLEECVRKLIDEHKNK
ncbi:MAG: hypothetical protein Terrestrivirus2_16 [Terrestrivirus sp.]|jgi:hypothetical protein|uniref:Uncharacterized protein n=1 Tax=Terrestrivirus sp. TaxID=2487775 RepID=A0A3G4ZKZ4_9VIRU|nr:MAG: hypothetical protein Terrestrivirus2_16 [Terrestrivirus sp.]